MKIALALSLLLLLADISRADAPTTAATQPAGKTLTKFRESGHLNQLMMMRTAVSELDLDEEIKKKAFAVMDKTREDILALVAREEATPSEANSRDASMAALLAKFPPRHAGDRHRPRNSRAADREKDVRDVAGARRSEQR
jgi:hypothetical protein